MKIAIIPTTGGSDPYKGMEVAVQLGVEAVHISGYGGGLDLENKSRSERAEILKRIRGYGLEVSALIGWGGNVDLGEEEGIKENIAWGKRLNEVAVDVAEGLWMAHVGIMPEEEAGPRWSLFRDSLAEIVNHGASIGATVALETGPEPPKVVRKMIEDIGSSGLRVNFDPANLLLWPPIIAKQHNVSFDYAAAMEKFDPVEGLRTLIPYVVHAHAKDSVLRPDGSAEEVPIGTGMTNWPVLYSIFQENGYKGYYAIERECGENAMEDVRNAVGFLRSLG
ncbi:MAG: sugar phosphate isomerase/epimerase [Armatimonadetes bacterium]|nr:sugar phosphate isomerase/epimerase [Armatimonadota bacterium]